MHNRPLSTYRKPQIKLEYIYGLAESYRSSAVFQTLFTDSRSIWEVLIFRSNRSEVTVIDHARESMPYPQWDASVLYQ